MHSCWISDLHKRVYILCAPACVCVPSLDRWKKWLWPCRTQTWAWRWETRGSLSLSFHTPWPVRMCHRALASAWTCTLLLVCVPAVMHNATMDFGEYCVLCRVDRGSLTSFPVSFLCLFFVQVVMWLTGWSGIIISVRRVSAGTYAVHVTKDFQHLSVILWLVVCQH